MAALESVVIFEGKSDVQIVTELDQENKARENSEWKKLEREILTSEGGAVRQSQIRKDVKPSEKKKSLDVKREESPNKRRIIN